MRLMPGGSQTKGKRPNPASYGAMPIFMSHGRGSRLWDVNGNSYIDYYGSSGGVLLGYCHPEVDRAVAEQLEKGMLFSTPSEPEIECAKLVNEVVPCSEMVRFLKGGVDVNLCATRIARAYTKREIILNNGYRGWADEWNYWRNDGGMPAAFHHLNQQFRFNDLNHLEELFALNDGKVAAVSFDCAEPRKEPEPGFLSDLKDLAHRNGALVIYDECMTGFRFALGGAQEYYGVEPDIATYAKGMANGMSLGAVAGRRDIMEKTADCSDQSDVRRGNALLGSKHCHAADLPRRGRGGAHQPHFASRHGRRGSGLAPRGHPHGVIRPAGAVWDSVCCR